MTAAWKLIHTQVNSGEPIHVKHVAEARNEANTSSNVLKTFLLEPYLQIFRSELIARFTIAKQPQHRIRKRSKCATPNPHELWANFPKLVEICDQSRILREAQRLASHGNRHCALTIIDLISTR